MMFLPVLIVKLILFIITVFALVCVRTCHGVCGSQRQSWGVVPLLPLQVLGVELRSSDLMCVVSLLPAGQPC